MKSNEFNMESPKAMEYEFLYNVRDQAILFLRMAPATEGCVAQVLDLVDGMVKTLGEEIVSEKL